MLLSAAVSSHFSVKWFLLHIHLQSISSDAQVEFIRVPPHHIQISNHSSSSHHLHQCPGCTGEVSYTTHNFTSALKIKRMSRWALRLVFLIGFCTWQQKKCICLIKMTEMTTMQYVTTLVVNSRILKVWYEYVNCAETTQTRSQAVNIAITMM